MYLDSISDQVSSIICLGLGGWYAFLGGNIKSFLTFMLAVQFIVQTGTFWSEID